MPNILVSAVSSVIGGGYGNKIDANSTYSVIAGGGGNSVGTNLPNYLSGNANFIGGGQKNCIGTPGHPANCSAILGGYGNTVPAGCSYVGIFGCNIGSIAGCVNSNTFHVNKLYMDSVPNVTAIGTCPNGTVYWDAIVGMPGCKGLFIK